MEIDACRVCGDSPAKMHYGVLACFGCKGFFRRTLKRPTEYTCRHLGKCVVDRHERNSCRYCRFRKCIEAGMDPKAVRPDRDATGRHFQGRGRRARTVDSDSELDSEWIRKLSVDMRTTLMQLMNIELMVTGGDGLCDRNPEYPLPFCSLRQILEDPTILDGKRTEMRYEGLRKVEGNELIMLAHRAIIAAIDWVDHLFELIDVQNANDKALLIRHSFAPLMIFNASYATARNTNTKDVLHQSNYGYVPRDAGHSYEEPYHFGGRVVPRALDELVDPLRAFHLREEEAVLFKAIIILNPTLRGLSPEGMDMISELRDRIQETLYHVVRETHPKEIASPRFGNILLFLPSVMIIGNVVYENLAFVQSFGQVNDLLLCDILSGLEQEDMTEQLPQNRCESEMIHSESCSSLESVSSSNFTVPTTSLPYNFSSPTLSRQNESVSPICAASSLPNLDQLQDSDPDYNVTLTPSMYAPVRQHQEASFANPNRTPPNSPSRPKFFIESTKHTFEVTATEVNRPDQSNGEPSNCSLNCFRDQLQSHPHHQQHPVHSQSVLCKSNSLPPPPYGAGAEWMTSSTPMDFDDVFYSPNS